MSVNNANATTRKRGGATAADLGPRHAAAGYVTWPPAMNDQSLLLYKYDYTRTGHRNYRSRDLKYSTGFEEVSDYITLPSLE